MAIESGSVLDWFRDTQGALRFAFSMSHRPIMATSSIFNQWQSHGVKIDRSRSDGRGLSMHDKHAQAAMVLHAVDELPELQRLVIYGYYDGAYREQAVEALAKIVDMPKGFPRILGKYMISEYLARDGRKARRQINRVQMKMVDDKLLPRAFTEGQLYYARTVIYKTLDDIDAAAHRSLEEKWSKGAQALDTGKKSGI